MAGAAPPSRPRKVLRAATVAAATGLMVLVPLQAIGGSEQAERFSWHMYTQYVSTPTIEVLTANGATEDVPVGEIVSGLRIEIDYFAPVADFLCRTRDDVVSVRMSSEAPQREEEFPCPGS